MGFLKIPVLFLAALATALATALVAALVAAPGGAYAETNQSTEEGMSHADRARALFSEMTPPNEDKVSSPERMGQAIGIGENKIKNIPQVVREDDDGAKKTSRPDVSTSAGGMFFRGERLDTDELGAVRYVYVSRGAWLVCLFQPIIDRLAAEVLRADKVDLTADFIEITRSFSRVAMLIASDDGSDQMLRAIARSVAVHRRAVSTLKLHWLSPPLSVKRLLNKYIELSFLKGVEADHKIIEAGSLASPGPHPNCKVSDGPLEPAKSGAADAAPKN